MTGFKLFPLKHNPTLIPHFPQSQPCQLTKQTMKLPHFLILITFTFPVLTFPTFPSVLPASQLKLQQNDTAHPSSQNLGPRWHANVPNSFSLYQSHIVTSRSPRLEKQIRSKRHLLQLGALVEAHTPYSVSQLVHYGNWCGLGGNRGLDFSAIVECDACCRVHDFCYLHLMYATRDYFLRNETQYYTKDPGTLRDNYPDVFLTPIRAGMWRPCFPHMDIYINPNKGARFRNELSCETNRGPGRTCTRGACQCDVDFIRCLQNTHC